MLPKILLPLLTASAVAGCGSGHGAPDQTRTKPSGGVSTSASGASADPLGWSVTDVQQQHTDGELHSVACPTRTLCWAVGSDKAGALVEQLENGHFVERYSGKQNLLGVACPGATECWAVGAVGDQVGRTAILHWTSGQWRPAAAPTDSQAGDSGLNAVSCASPTDCWAVGDAENSNGDDASQAGFALHYDGSSWSPAKLPAIDAQAGWKLDGISCTTDHRCWAYGSFAVVFSDGNVPYPVTERLENGRWTIKDGPGITRTDADGGPASTTLAGVACPTADECVAAGSYTLGQGGSGAAVAEYSGTTWVRNGGAPDLLDGEDPQSRLTAIACQGPQGCWAVGSATTATGFDPAFVHFVDNEWQVANSPDPGFHHPNSGDLDQLDSIACPTPTDCWAVGDVGGDGADVFTLPLIEHLRSKPAPQTAPTGDNSKAIGQVSTCAGKAAITAYNLNCAEALSIYQKLPEGWGGANSDEAVKGGCLGYLYKNVDMSRVSTGLRPDGQFDESKLNGAPVVRFVSACGE